MSMKGIVLIIPYFGKLPSWIQLFLNSCSFNREVNFLFFTDDKTIMECNIPDNVAVEFISFQELKKMFVDKVGKLYLGHPYKLCEYKPLYGYVFQDYIRGYEYWGHCDIDLIFGDIMHFPNKIDYRKYDRIFPLGHLSLYRNDEKNNRMFLRAKRKEYRNIADFSLVCSTTYPCHFDEVGMTAIYRKEPDVNFFDDTFHLQIYMHRLHIRTSEDTVPELVLFDKGDIWLLRKEGNEIIKSKHIYIHFQNRKSMPAHFDTKNVEQQYIVTHEGFVPYDCEKVDGLFVKYGRPDTDEENRDFVNEFEKNRKKGVRQRLVREIRENHILAPYYILRRIMNIIYLKKNGLF